MREETYEYEARCIHDTGRAIKVTLSTGETKWVPNWAVHEDSEVYETGGEGKLVVLARFAEDEGWE